MGANPEVERAEQIRKEEESLKRAIRQESMQRRQRERQMAAASARHRRSVFDSPMDSDEDTGVSLNAIKRNAKAGLLASTSRNRGKLVLISHRYFRSCCFHMKWLINIIIDCNSVQPR